jgi:hypothetical protein
MPAMSEYQYYEFAAIDRPLTRQEMSELRGISSRATISATRFQNEYHWGDLKADSAELLKKYFDAHLYYANWGQQTVMFRVPKAAVDVEALRPWFNGESAGLEQAGEHVILTISPYWDDPPDDWIDASLGDFVPLRAALLEGDLTLAYLAWLTSVVYEDYDDDDEEPPVPPALASPSAAVYAFADLMFIEHDLISSVSEGAPVITDEAKRVRDWLAGLSAEDKDRWLRRALENPHAPLGAEITAAWRRAHPVGESSQRKVSELFKRADEIKQQRQEKKVRERELARARAEAERKEHLKKLAANTEAAWEKLEKHLSLGDYDEAVQLAVDLSEVYTGRRDEFIPRFRLTRIRYKKKTAFARRLPPELKAIK